MSVDASVISMVVQKPSTLRDLQRSGITAEYFVDDYASSTINNMVERTCEGSWCSNTFRYFPSQNQRFCSRDCMHRWRTEKLRSEWWDKNYRRGKKLCHNCNKWKPPAEFGKGTKLPDLLQLKCKTCCASATAAWRGQHRDLIATRRRLAKYNVSEAEYQRMFKKQKGKCAICRNLLAHKINTDHCHETGAVRGLLCDRCNLALGLVHDDIRLLRRMEKYLVSR